MCGCLSHAPYWRPGLQPRHVAETGNPTSNPMAQSTEPHRPGLMFKNFLVHSFKQLFVEQYSRKEGCVRQKVPLSLYRQKSSEIIVSCV